MIPTGVSPNVAAESQTGSPADLPRGFGIGMILLGLAMVVNTVFGPLLLDMIDYPVSDSMRNQTIGLDAANLVVVAPLAIVVGWLALSGHRAAPLLALGPTTYVAYMFVQYLAGPDHLNYPPVLLLQLVIFISSWLLTYWAWNLVRQSDRPIPTPQPAHSVPAAGLMAAFVALRYLPGLIGSITNEPLAAEVAADPAMYWLIFLMDLGIFVPIAVLTAIGLSKGARWAPSLFTGTVTWFALITVAVAAMSITMIVNDDPNASIAQLAVFAGITAIVVPYALRVLVSPAASCHYSSANSPRP